MSPVNFNLVETSPSYAKQCYIDYYYNGNTMGITADEMGYIVGLYNNKINSWNNYVETDDNNYYVDDDDWENGHEWALDDSGYNHDNDWKQPTRTITDGTVTLAGNTVGKYYAGKLGANIGEKIAEKVAKKAGKKAHKYGQKAADFAGKKDYAKAEKYGNKADKAAKKAESANNMEWSLLASCALDGVMAATYRIEKPNEEQKKAIDVYAEKMPELQDAALENQCDLDSYDMELIDLGDLANETVDSANTGMFESKAEYESNNAIIEYTQKAVTAGYQLSEKDIKTYQETTEMMTKLGDDVQSIKDDSEMAVQEVYEEMSEYQSYFDEITEDIGERAGYTAEASSIDDSTEVQCKVESVSQGLNAATALVDGGKAVLKGSASSVAFGAGAVYLVAGAIALLAAASDTAAAVEQGKWADETHKEVVDREKTSEINGQTLDLYNENADFYQGYMEDVEGLEFEVPDDMEVPAEELPGQQDDDGKGGGGRTKKPST